MTRDLSDSVITPGDPLGDELVVTSVLPRASHDERGQDYAGRPARLDGRVHLSAIDADGEVVLLHYRQREATTIITDTRAPTVSTDAEDWRPCYCIEEANEDGWREAA